MPEAIAIIAEESQIVLPPQEAQQALSLSERLETLNEQQVFALELVYRGLSNKRAAERMGLTTSIFRGKLLKPMLQELDVDSKYTAAYRAYDMGLFSVGEAV